MPKKPSLKIVIVYENFIAGIRGREISERLAAQLKSDVDVNSGLWKFDLLDNPTLRDQASAEAINADIVIISVRNCDLPHGVHEWLEGWLPAKKQHDAALVAVIEPDQESGSEAHQLQEHLRSLAAKASMDFFCNADWSKPAQEQGAHDWESSLAYAGRDTGPRWGIND
jgi:hypothetical protein